MTDDEALFRLAALHGIDARYQTIDGGSQQVGPESQRALLAAMGVPVETRADLRDALGAVEAGSSGRQCPTYIIVESGHGGHRVQIACESWSLTTEDELFILKEGGQAEGIALPPLPSGVYVLRFATKAGMDTVTVLAAPPQLPSLPALCGHDRLWGVTLALYGLRSERNSGRGDLEDLSSVAEVFASQGASFVGTNPVHAMGAADTQTISPYSPSDRAFLDSANIALDLLPGHADFPGMDALQALRRTERVDYAAHGAVHAQALEFLFDRFLQASSDTARAEFETFRAQDAAPLAAHVKYEALSEMHGPDWRNWPDRLGKVDPRRMSFHAWLQWVAGRQMARAQAGAQAAGMPLGLYLDLAVGPRRGGGESWRERDTMAQGVSLGAPPDQLNPAGQNWGLAAYSPARLRAERYAPLRCLLAQTMKHAGAIRIDHILGFNRSFWIPDNGAPGAFVKHDFDAMLAIIKIEAERHGCLVIGEDLGLVPPGFSQKIQSEGLLSYSVLQFEIGEDGRLPPPDRLPAQALACFATHDMPTVAGYAQARDVDWWHDLGWIDNAEAERLRQSRAKVVAATGSGPEFQRAVHECLAQSDAGLVAVQLDDILSQTEAQNLPGTTDSHPNWQRKYDLAVADMPASPKVRTTAEQMRAAGRNP